MAVANDTGRAGGRGMMIASSDVRRVTFELSMRGYRREDVDDYLKKVADSMDYLIAENDELQKTLQVLADRIEQYRAEEDTLHTTLINAQRLGENVIRGAKQKAADIIRAANIKAEDREMRARDEVELAKRELAAVKRETSEFKHGLMEMYRKHIEAITKIPEVESEEPSVSRSIFAAEPIEPIEVPDVEIPTPPVVYNDDLPAEAELVRVESVEEPKEPVSESFEELPLEAPQAVSFEEEEPAAPVQAAEMIPETEEENLLLEPVLPLETEPETGKEDTREFETAEPKQEDELPASRYQPGAGLYGDFPEEPKPKPTPRSRSSRSKNGTASSGRNRRRRDSSGDSLPSGLDSFAGIDFES